MVEIFLHGHLAIYIGIALSLTLMIAIGALAESDKTMDFWENVPPAIICGIFVFFLWQILLILVAAICLLILPVYFGRLIGKMFRNLAKKKKDEVSENDILGKLKK